MSMHTETQAKHNYPHFERKERRVLQLGLPAVRIAAHQESQKYVRSQNGVWAPSARSRTQLRRKEQ